MNVRRLPHYTEDKRRLSFIDYILFVSNPTSLSVHTYASLECCNDIVEPFPLMRPFLVFFFLASYWPVCGGSQNQARAKEVTSKRR